MVMRTTIMRRCGAAIVCAMCALPAACRKHDTQKPEPLLCHVGGTMRPVMRELAAMYEQQTGQEVRINSAGSGELLAHIESHKEGDVYVCHDPFLDALMKRGLGAEGWSVAELTPVIVVRKGNPEGIHGLADLTRPDVELFLTDYRKSSLGRMLNTIFGKAGIDFDRLNRQKKIGTHRMGSHAANMVRMRNADAAICWNAVAHLQQDALDVVPIPQKHLPTPHVDTVTSATMKAYDLMPMRVTVATLNCSVQPGAARRFAEFVASERCVQVFRSFGFTVVPTGTGKAYDAGWGPR